MADRITPEEVARLRALIAEQAAEIKELRRDNSRLWGLVPDGHPMCGGCGAVLDETEFDVGVCEDCEAAAEDTP